VPAERKHVSSPQEIGVNAPSPLDDQEPLIERERVVLSLDLPAPGA
jgi:hypothetical protein